jgi:precorrin-2/cobalt-factor-2 C20-methyltransferase
MGAHGKLFGIGVGTGDPELLTLKGWKILRSVEIVAYPAGRKGQPTLPELVAKTYTQPHQQHLPLPMPLNADPTLWRTAWQTATLSIVQHLRQGTTLAFVCEGSATVHSVFMHIWLGVKSKCPQASIEVIPGVSSLAIASSIAGIPLGLDQDKLIIFPEFTNMADLEDALRWAEIIVLLNVAPVYREVWQILRAHKLLGCSHVVANAQYHWSDLTDRPLLNLPPLALLLVNRSHETALLGY